MYLGVHLSQRVFVNEYGHGAFVRSHVVPQLVPPVEQLFTLTQPGNIDRRAAKESVSDCRFPFLNML